MGLKRPQNIKGVLPVWNSAGQLIAVLDIDSDLPNAFTEEDKEQLSAILQQVFGRPQ